MKSNIFYLLIISLLSCSHNGFAMNIFGEVGTTAIRWFGEVVIDATKNPVIYLKRAAPVAKKLAEEGAKDPKKAIITLAGIATAAGGIVEYKIASVGVEKGIDVAKKAKKSMDESKLEETAATPYYDETV